MKIHHKYLLLSVMIFVTLLTSCNQNLANKTNDSIVIDNEIIIQYTDQTMEPFIFPTSNPGFASIKGRLIVLNLSMLPANEDAIFLVPINATDQISTIPTFQPDEVPRAVVDERTGDFEFQDIEPGKYVLIVLTQSDAQIPASYKENGSYVIFDINESDIDKTYDLGDINFP